MIFGFDIATRCVGYCAGDGASRPNVDALTYEHVGRDLGALAQLWEADLNRLETRYGTPRVVVYEAPIWPPFPDLLAYRKIYGMGMQLERWALDRGAIMAEVDLRTMKSRLTGDHKAKKPQMVAMAKRLKIDLPAGKIAEDAADAFAAWLAGGIDHYGREHQHKWDELLYGSRGALL